MIRRPGFESRLSRKSFAAKTIKLHHFKYYSREYMIQNNYKQQLDKCLDLFLQFGLSFAAPEKCDSIRAPYSLFYLLSLISLKVPPRVQRSLENSQKESHYYYYY